jgi:8-oxo-dGTP diphosphatase
MIEEPSDILDYKRPGVAVDIVVLAIIDGELKVGLVKREEEPFKGKHAMPGRFVRYDERLIDTARMALRVKGNIDPEGTYLEQLHAFGDSLDRDTRIRTISITYYCLINNQTVLQQKENKFIWQPAYRLSPLAWDHAKIITFAIERIRSKLFHSDLVFKLVPQEFTLTELQRIFELLLNTTLDKRNFRKKIQEIYVLKDLRKTKMEGAHRPAAVYSYARMVD